MELLKKTVGSLFDETALKFSENEALVDISKGVRYSYREFLDAVNDMSKGFIRLGLKKGEHLALWGANRWEWIITEFAAAKIGVVLISVDINYQLQQLEYLLKQSDSKTLVMTEGLKGSEYIEIVIGYGLTESSSWITETRPDDPLELRVSTVGRPLPYVEVKIIDTQSGQEVPTGTSGEICARGLNMKGYYKMPAATANAIDSNGWLHSGDLGYLDGNGYVRTTGRLKEVISKGGEVIYPTEIEEVLFTHPNISNVQVFGVPDKMLGEEVAAWIKLEEGARLKEEEVLKYCKAKLPTSQVPHYLKFVSEIPMTPLDKIQKFKMREAAIKEYGLE